MPADQNNPSVVSLPYTFTNVSDYPTEVMADRFQAWRYIIKDLVVYLKEFASVQEEIIRQQMRLQQAVGTSNSSPAVNNNAGSHHSASANSNTTRREEVSAVNRFFLPIGNGSIQDIPGILTRYHQQNVTNASKTLKEINSLIIPKLEELRKDLLVKIKEIKNLQNDFKTDLGKELQETRQLLVQYQQAIELSSKLENGSVSHHHHLPDSGGASEHGKYDPYLVKIKLDRQLKRQLSEEHYLYQAYSNLQNAGGKLESIIVLEIQNYLSQLMGLLDNENSTFSNFLLANLNNGFLSKEASFEWDSFISRNLPTASAVSALSNNSSSVKSGSFIDLSFPVRKLTDLVIPNFDSTLNNAVREGMLERRSKYLKSYSSGWYVLTCNYLHEFKTSDRKKDPQPAMSLPLDSCTVSDHSKDDGKIGGVYKFILSSKSSSGLMNRTHNWVFRTDTYKSMIDWYTDIKSLTGLSNPSARARFLNKNRPEASKVTSTSAAVSGHISPGSHRISRNSSIASTAARSLATNNNGASSPTRQSSVQLNNSKQRPLSQATSIFNANRLSSTFSQKNNQSPRLANMINSDGTIIASVEYEDGKSPLRTPSQPPLPRETQQEYLQQQQPNQEYHQQEYQHAQIPIIQTGSLAQQAQQHSRQISSQFVVAPTSLASPTSGAPPATSPSVPIQAQGNYLAPQNIQYYIPPQGNQQPQFYDPIQQQFFTLTPSLPPGQVSQPQPQYFPSSPQPPAQQQGEQLQPSVSTNTTHLLPVQSQPMSVQHPDSQVPYTINTANYFPQYATQQIPIQHSQQFGENLPLPYPTSSPDGASSSRVRGGSNSSVVPDPVVSAPDEEVNEPTNDETEDYADDIKDEVSTLQSQHDLKSVEAK